MLDSPLVSVVITTYKRSNMLSRAINSILEQTYKSVEVIVVDDNDPNTEYRLRTEQIMKNYSEHPTVNYIRHSKNMNGATARNTGISNSKGEYICFLDDDDWYKVDKIEKQINYLLRNPQFNAVYCGWYRDGDIVLPTKEGDLTFEILSGASIIYTNTIMVKKDSAEKCGAWDVNFRRNQEAAFLLRYFSFGFKIGVISEVLVEFDVSDRSNASNPKENEKDFDLLLDVYNEQVEQCNLTKRNAKDIIYSYRYRGVFLNYVKHQKIKDAIIIYIKMTKKIPIRFNRDLGIYFFNKIQKKDVF